MTIALRAAGTSTAATAAVTALNPSTPSGIQPGDLSILAVEVKGSTAGVAPTIATPTGWTLVGAVTNNGTLDDGTDTGSNTVGVFSRVSAPASTAVGTLAITGADNGGAVVNTYSNATGAWDVTSTTAADTTSGANGSLTGAAGIALAAGDWITVVCGLSGDIGSITGQGFTATGATVGTVVSRTTRFVSTGTDSRLLVIDAPITAGTSSAAPVYTYDNASPTTSHARMVRIREATPSGPATNFAWRTSDGVIHPCTAKWRTAGGVLKDVSLETAAPATPFRAAFDWPFKIAAFTNVSLGANATYEGNVGRTAKFLTGTPTLNGLDEGTGARWSYPYYLAKTTDPLRAVINASTGATITTIRIPDNAVPTAGTDLPVGIVAPDGYSGHELYKFVRLSSGNVSTTYYNANDLRGDGLQRGSRASGISLFIGTIRAQEALDRNIPHTLAIACSKLLLNNAPTSADGTVITNSQGAGVWPARQIDTQSNEPYSNATNSVAMGSMWAIPPSVDITTLGLSADGLALATCLQDFGAHILLQSSLCALYVHPSSDATVNARYAAMKSAWINVLFAQMRRVTNNIPGTLVSNSPVSNATVAGGGTRRRPDALPLLEDQP